MRPAGNDQDNVTRFSPRGVVPGTRLNGVYEIDALIANGGMGEIYKAHNIQTMDPVAIKMILPEFSGNPDAIGLFRREASALHNLQHDAIVRYYVFSVDPDLGRAYLAMEFVEGPSLGDLFESGPLDPAAAGLLLVRMAEALAAAHRAGVVHRDISPDNIVVPNRDPRRAKLIDFGIARVHRVGEGTIIGSNFAGKYNYVSPEQLGLAGGEVTAKSDIYSLGLVIAGALLGRPLDMSGTQLEVIEKRRHVPDLSAIPGSMRPILEAMLQPLPSDRPADLTLFAGAVPHAPESPFAPKDSPPRQAEVAQVQSRFTDPRPRSGRGKWLVIASVTAVLVLGGGLAAIVFDRISPGSWSKTTASSGTGGPVVSGVAVPSPKDEPLRPPAGPLDASPADGTGTSGDAGKVSPPPRIAPQQSAKEIIASLGGRDDTVAAPPIGPRPEASGTPDVAPPSAMPSQTASPGAADFSEPPVDSERLSSAAEPVSVTKIADFLRDFESGSCVAVKSSGVTAGSIKIEGLGQDAALFRKLSSALAGRFGVSPDIDARTVAASQCGAVDMVSALGANFRDAPTIHIDHVKVGVDQPLSGTIGNLQGRQLHLLLLSNDGEVINLDGSLRGEKDGTSFSIVLTPDSSSVDEPQLLIATVSPTPTPSLIDFSTADAASFIPRLRDEIARAGGSVDASVFELTR